MDLNNEESRLIGCFRRLDASAKAELLRYVVASAMDADEQNAKSEPVGKVAPKRTSLRLVTSCDH
jgi:hypothetical protein